MCFQRCVLAFALLVALAVPGQADIYRWDNGEVIPGTEGIEPGPGVQLDHRELDYARLRELDLTGASFERSDLSHAWLQDSLLTGVDFTDAIVAHASFDDTYGGQSAGAGISLDQLYSTASYKLKSLEGLGLSLNDLSRGNFRGQNLEGAKLSFARLTDADFTGAQIRGARLVGAGTAGGLTKDQLYSTASYRAQDLAGIVVGTAGGIDLSGWDFSDQNLTGAVFGDPIFGTDGRINLANASFFGARLTNAHLGGTVLEQVDFNESQVEGVRLWRTTQHGFSPEQLYSTKSYREKSLRRIDLSQNDLTGWDFSGQNLADAGLHNANMTNANLSGANLANAFLRGSTLTRVNLSSADLTNADLIFSLLTNAELGGSNFTGANLSAADMRGSHGIDLTGAITWNAILPNGTITGLDLAGGGRCTIRNFPIQINVQGHMTVGGGGADSRLEMLFDATPWESTISFEPGIPIQLGGTLELNFADNVDVTSQLGRTFHIFDWTNVEPLGQFRISSGNISGQARWDVSQLYTSGEVTLLLPGDTNGDRTVDLNDLNNVRNNFGLTGEGVAGDSNGDQLVDLTDLNNVRNYFGASLPQAVPEPTSFILFVAMLVWAFPVIPQLMHSKRNRVR